VVATSRDGKAHLEGPVFDEELEEIFEGGGGVIRVDGVGEKVAVVGDGDDLAGEEAAVCVAGVDGAFVDIEQDGYGVGAVARAGGEAAAGVGAEAEEFEGVGFGFEGDVADALDREGDAEGVEPGFEGEIGAGGEPVLVGGVGGAGVFPVAVGAEEAAEGVATVGEAGAEEAGVGVAVEGDLLIDLFDERAEAEGGKGFGDLGCDVFDGSAVDWLFAGEVAVPGGEDGDGLGEIAVGGEKAVEGDEGGWDRGEEGLGLDCF
jgi:hypothetical protein